MLCLQQSHQFQIKFLSIPNQLNIKEVKKLIKCSNHSFYYSFTNQWQKKYDYLVYKSVTEEIWLLLGSVWNLMDTNYSPKTTKLSLGYKIQNNFVVKIHQEC